MNQIWQDYGVKKIKGEGEGKQAWKNGKIIRRAETIRDRNGIVGKRCREAVQSNKHKDNDNDDSVTLDAMRLDATRRGATRRDATQRNDKNNCYRIR